MTPEQWWALLRRTWAWFAAVAFLLVFAVFGLAAAVGVMARLLGWWDR
jgi:hypothetical protein